VKETGERVSSEEVEKLMLAYEALDAFPDVETALQTVAKLDPDLINAIIFSNGTSKMVQASVRGSPILLERLSVFSQNIAVDDMPEAVRKYKPAPDTYEYLVERVGGRKGEAVLVTSNPFDVDGAKRFGLRVCWLNRLGTEWIDGIGIPPDWVCKSLGECLERILEVSKENEHAQQGLSP
jgi:2-haloacid dehalogenase